MGKGDTHKMEAHFSVVLVEVPQDGQAETAAALGEALHLQPEAAKQVLSTAPVVLFRDLAKPEIRALKPKLLELSRRGVEFRITPRPADSLPSVNWPTKPGFAQSGGGELLPSVTFEWQQHAFVCPGCGEAFVIRSIGKPVLTKREEAKAPSPTPAPAPKPAPPKEEKKAAPPPPKPAPAKVAAKKVEEVEEIEEIQEISEPLEVVEEIEEVQEISEPLEVADEVEEIQEISDSEPIEEVEEIAEASGEDIEMIDLDESPKKAAPTKRPPEKKAAPPPKPEAKKPPERKPAKKSGDDEEEEEGEGEIAYSVFLSRIPTPDKQSQAAKMIAEIRGVSMGEAKDLAARMVIPVVKDVSKEEAEQCLERFKKLKIQGRITKKK